MFFQTNILLFLLQINNDLIHSNIQPNSIRLIRKRKTGKCRIENFIFKYCLFLKRQFKKKRKLVSCAQCLTQKKQAVRICGVALVAFAHGPLYASAENK